MTGTPGPSMIEDQPTEEHPGAPFTRADRTLAWMLSRLEHRSLDEQNAARPALDEFSEARRLPDAEVVALTAALGVDEPNPRRARPWLLARLFGRV